MRTASRWWLSPLGAWLTMLLWTGVVLWGCWERLDLQPADTSAYFASGYSWMQNGHFAAPGELVFSPLYAMFFGTVQGSFSDAYTATIVHRLLIVAAAAAAVLGLARSVLPRAWAWLLAAWWVALPQNSYAYFEVHVFGFALITFGCWLAGAGDGRFWRGAGLAVISVAALTVRNEFTPAALLFAAACAVFEIRRARLGKQTMQETKKAFRQLLVPSVIVACLATPLWFAERNTAHWDDLRAAFAKRSRANLRQVYPFGYRQRHADWQGDPWWGGGDLMKRDFGRDDPTFGEAARFNPRAVMEHILWNARLIPAGLQLALFGTYAGAIAPDFGTTPENSRWTWWSSIAVTISVVAGLFSIRHQWLRQRHRTFPGAWTWVALFCCLPTSLIAIATQRPRPSYIYTLTLLLMVLAMAGARAIAGKVRVPAWLHTALPQAASFALLVIVLSIAARARPQPRPMLEDYRRLAPFERLFSDPANVFASNTARSSCLVHYLARDNGKAARAQPFPLDTDGALSFQEVLEKSTANVLYLTGDFLSRPDFHRWQTEEVGRSWQVVASAQTPAATWLLARRIQGETRMP